MHIIKLSNQKIGLYFTKNFDSYPEEWIKAKCEKLADNGWELLEINGSNSYKGKIFAMKNGEDTTIEWERI